MYKYKLVYPGGIQTMNAIIMLLLGFTAGIFTMSIISLYKWILGILNGE